MLARFVSVVLASLLVLVLAWLADGDPKEQTFRGWLYRKLLG